MFLLALSVVLVVYIPIYQEAADDTSNIEARLVVKDSNPTIVWSADGQKLYTVSSIQRTVVDLRDLPKYVGEALVAAEDRRFYDHKGVDPIGLLRVAFTTVRDRHAGQGGSTISMQLAKQMVTGDERTITRKLRQIATAQQIENLKTKEEILNLYANEVYYGQGAFGIERAAQVYFKKSAKKLTIAEAAMLARCVRQPSRVNPVKTLRRSLAERDYVLQVMRDENWITEGQYQQALREVPKLNPNPNGNRVQINGESGYFVQHALQQFEQDFPGVDYREGGYNIYTTLNYRLQKRAIAAVKQILAENRGHKVNDGAIVVMDGNGRIMAEVGGADYDKRQFNVITHGFRQPGSAFKAFVYATGLRNGVLHPGSTLDNSPVNERNGDGTYYRPQNASRNENRSTYSLEDAFAYSVNRAAVHALKEIGPENVVAAARDVFGFKSKLHPYLSLALGTSEVSPLEMLEGYSVFMLGGDRVKPQPLARVVGPDGTELRRYDPVRYVGVLDPTVAKEMDRIMLGPVQYGTATWARDKVPNAHGKTGTTNDAKDAWFCGYSDGLIGVGWVGNSSRKGSALAMSSSVFGGTVTVKIWTQVMQAAHNLGLAKGLPNAPSSPTTSVTVSTAPAEPEVPPLHETPQDAGAPKSDPASTPDETPTKDPIVIEPASTTPDDPPLQDPDVPQIDPTDQGLVPADQVDRKPARRDPPRRDPPRRPSPPAEETVSVEICVDSGMKASMYCPETVIKQFPKRRAPRKICTIHHG